MNGESNVAFAPEHVQYFERRAIPVGVVQAIGARSMNLHEAASALGRPPDTIPSGGLAIPYPQATGFWRIRMDKDDAGKFLTPGGVRVRPYLPPAALIDPLSWDDNKVVITFVEGPWKAVALAAAGIAAIGLAGCEAGGHDPENDDDALHPDLIKLVKWQSRTVIIMMDAGRAWNPNVLRGENRLARCLLRAGAKVRIAKLPPKGGMPHVDQGPDDFLAQQGAVALRQVIDDATPWKPADGEQAPFARLVTSLRSMKNLGGEVCLNVRAHGPGKLGWNEMMGCPTLDEEALSDADVGRLRLYFASRGESYRVEDLWSAVTIVAQEAPYHPIRRYLEGLQWDGIERIKLLPNEVLHLTSGRADTEQDTNVTTPLSPAEAMINVRLLLCFLIAAVMRAMKPGCKVDTALILKGEQGTFKSTFFRVLAGEQWFCDSDLDIGDQQTTPMVMGRAWICEWPELENLKRAREATQVKAFLSRAVDLYRPPYGRAVVSHPRSSVIVGTTNDDAFLTDVSGNRRWHVVVVGGRIEIEKLKAWRDQLWAEVMVLYRNGERHWLNEAEELLLTEIQERHFMDHPWTAAVVRWLHANHLRDGALTVTTEAVLTEALKKDLGSITKNDEMAVAGILRKLKWTNLRKRIGGVRERIWFPPPDWLWSKRTSADADETTAF